MKVRVDPVPLTAEARQERMGQLVSQLGTADILADLDALLARDGFSGVAEAVGTGAR